MIVWINGAFGAGKTQVSHELLRRLDRGWISDPEPLGFAIQGMQPPAARLDFQDEPLWRSGIREVLGRLDRQQVGTAPVAAASAQDGQAQDDPAEEAVTEPLIIVPMTLVQKAYFDEIVGVLRTDGHDVRHFALQASRATLLHRLRRRGLFVRGLRRDQWAVEQIERCSAALVSPGFEVGIATDELSIAGVVEAIAAQIGLPLVRPLEARPRGLIRNLGVQVRHLRW